jgi:hypothetical protein
MAHSSWDEIDNDTHDYKEVYCAFIDILGYKEKSELFFANKFNLYGRIDRAFSTIKLIEELTAPLVDKSDMEIDIFSDSIIITIPIREFALSTLLQYVSCLSANLSFEDLLVRGGISKGKHIHLPTKKTKIPFLSSIALQKAYSLEQKAEMPRTVIDPEIIPDINPTDKMFIVEDGEHHIVHFAPVLINRNGENPLDVEAEMKDIHERMKDKNGSVQKKYSWLLDYYYWTITQSNNFDISKYEKFKSDPIQRFSTI